MQYTACTHTVVPQHYMAFMIVSVYQLTAYPSDAVGDSAAIAALVSPIIAPCVDGDGTALLLPLVVAFLSPSTPCLA
jgi:hypothetical protein